MIITPVKEKSYFEKGKNAIQRHPYLTASLILGGLAVYFYGSTVIASLSSLFSKSASSAPPVRPAPTAPVPPVPSSVSPSSAIHVFTSYTKDNPERLAMSLAVAANQRAYCETKGYRYEVYEENLAKGNLPYWSKIAGINRLLENKNENEFVVWLDDDAVIANEKIDLHAVIQDLSAKHPGADIFVTQDVPHAHTKLNTGVLLVRNTEFSRKFFKELMAMSSSQVPRLSGTATYGNCPNQVCLHEQEAMHDLLNEKPEYKKYVQIIPQRDDQGLGINTFSRVDHFDDNRGGLHLFYGDDPESSTYKQGDFITQCTGLSTKGRLTRHSPQANLRKECIDELIKNSIRA